MRILLIEEDDFVSSLLFEKLKQDFACQIDTVKFPQKGLRYLKTERPYDFIIADYQSIECLGFELMEFQDRHSIPGKFVFYTNNQYLESSLLSPSSSVVHRYHYENLRQFIIKNVPWKLPG